jgi:hypothetical protein
MKSGRRVESLIWGVEYFEHPPNRFTSLLAKNLDELGRSYGPIVASNVRTGREATYPWSGPHISRNSVLHMRIASV